MPERKIISVSGLYSGIGKTLLSERLLGLSPGMAAIKVTINDRVTEVLDDEASIMVPGKDTWRMMRSGAAAVIWVRARESELPGALADALGRCRNFDRLLIEGNSVLAHLQPVLAFFVCDSRMLSDKPPKPSRAAALARADIIVHNTRAGDDPSGSSVEAAVRRYNETAPVCAADLGDTGQMAALLPGLLQRYGFLRLHCGA